MKVNIEPWGQVLGLSHCMIELTDLIGDEHRILLRPSNLQELKVAIEKYQEEQPFRIAKGATGK